MAHYKSTATEPEPKPEPEPEAARAPQSHLLAGLRGVLGNASKDNRKVLTRRRAQPHFRQSRYASWTPPAPPILPHSPRHIRTRPHTHHGARAQVTNSPA